MKFIIGILHIILARHLYNQSKGGLLEDDNLLYFFLAVGFFFIGWQTIIAALTSHNSPCGHK